MGRSIDQISLNEISKRMARCRQCGGCPWSDVRSLVVMSLGGVIRHYVRRLGRTYLYEDIVSHVTVKVIELVDRWGTSGSAAGAFEAHLRMTIRWAIFSANRDRQTTKSDATYHRHKSEGETTGRGLTDGDVLTFPRGLAWIEIVDGLSTHLTDAERRIVLLRLQGWSRKEIAQKLGWSYTSICRFLSTIGDKLEGFLFGHSSG